ncbi:phosphonoacetaldehyde hydrolase [Marinobacterium lutimaris]|uniref:Phosphonoacetaldehyde hydrolase n=1 Tax=Marinobacterium lutimaris TaxID=568106 RepID=A0A1H5XGL6_9GAMM|nr:phosphonoacetaldehyde hydrolase [Marinobacterium lutimaris]SEG10336.1 phosphonoacetaldehyde hydrolase [Marinobacterium lutimaris]
MYSYKRHYTGPVQAVILDWAGTTVDFGSLAPIHAFTRLFAAEGVPITEAEARKPMGSEKREHVRLICEMPRVAESWKARFGSVPSSADVDRLYEKLIPLQVESIRERATLIPGMAEFAAWAGKRGIGLGGNTGYATEMVPELLQLAANQGYAPGSNVCATEVPKARPWPHMSLRNAMELGVSNLAACIKVDDTPTGIEEGLNAGMWTIGVAISGNQVGLDLPQWQALSINEQAEKRAAATDIMARSGAHYVIDSVADIIPVIEEIERRLAKGEHPAG